MKCLVLALAACGSSTAPPAPRPEPPRAPDPKVDMACVERARDGKLLEGLPTEAGAFHVTTTADGAHLHRDGRALTDAESASIWQRIQNEAFAGGLSSGSSGHSSIYTCDDSPKNNCYKLSQWLCQLDLETLATRVATTFERAGFVDAMISIDTTFNEIHGPPCRKRAACTPVAHYSTKSARYDPKARRIPVVGHDYGPCQDDGDCSGADSNNCMSWYLRGGGEADVYIMHRRPTFCGCVEQRCTWFNQN